MKKTASFLTTALLTLSLAGNVSAADGEILTGTPIIDGKVDAMYKNSLTLETGKGTNAYNTDWDDANGSIYFLHDDSYLYICAEIIDNDVTTIGEEECKKENPFKNDNCEFRLSLDGGTTTIKLGIDAYGYRAYGLKANEALIDYSTIQYKTTYTDTSYVIEAAIPCTEGVLDMKTAGKLGFKLQLNDLTKDGNHYNFATDYAGEGAKGLVFYNLSSESAAPAVTNAPKTADPITAALALCTAAGAIVCFSKKHAE
ncbi:MAG: hypothetical protein IJ493_11055 [Clostridia bacterium]|nr:hypothetical protein [Clostridia bacterium]